MWQNDYLLGTELQKLLDKDSLQNEMNSAASHYGVSLPQSVTHEYERDSVGGERQEKSNECDAMCLAAQKMVWGKRVTHNTPKANCTAFSWEPPDVCLN